MGSHIGQLVLVVGVDFELRDVVVVADTADVAEDDDNLLSDSALRVGFARGTLMGGRDYGALPLRTLATGADLRQRIRPAAIGACSPPWASVFGLSVGPATSGARATCATCSNYSIGLDLPRRPQLQSDSDNVDDQQFGHSNGLYPPDAPDEAVPCLGRATGGCCSLRAYGQVLEA